MLSWLIKILCILFFILEFYSLRRINYSSHFLYVLSGGDMAAGPVWMEYIAFLKSLPVCLSFCPLISVIGEIYRTVSICLFCT